MSGNEQKEKVTSQEQQENTQQREEERAHAETHKEMENLKGDVISSIKEKLTEKLGAENPQVEIIIAKIEKLAKPGRAVKLRGFANKLKGIFSTITSFAGKGTAEIETGSMESSIHSIADQVHDIESKFGDIEGKVMQATMAGGESTGDAAVDSSVQVLNTQVEELKKTKDITVKGYKLAYDQMLQQFLVSIGGKVQQPAAQTENVTPPTVENLTAGAMTAAEIDELIAKYPPDMKNYCLKEVRVFMQKLHKQGLVSLPANLDNEKWGGSAKDFGKELKYFNDNRPANRETKNFSKETDDASKHTQSITSMKGSIFNIVMTKKSNPEHAGHICVAFRQGNEVVVYDNSFAKNADRGSNKFSLEQYLKLRTEEGNYKLDSAVSMPLEAQKLTAYAKRTENTAATATA